MNSEVKLSGATLYNPRFPPADAKKGYVARITGREAGPVKYRREFLGSTLTVLEGDEGLYERQVAKKSGGATRFYHVILSHPEHGLIMSDDCEAAVPKIAAMLDKGIAVVDAVEVANLRPSPSVPSLMIFDAVPRTASQAKIAAMAQTVDAAVEACWQVLVVLTPIDAKKAMAALTARCSASETATSATG